MKITNLEAVRLINIFDGMGDKTLPRQLSYAVNKNLEKLKSEINKPYEKERVNILRKYAVVDENGNQKSDSQGRLIYSDRKAYEDEMNQLLEIENDFEAHCIEESLIDQCEKESKYSDLSVKEYGALMKIIK